MEYNVLLRMDLTRKLPENKQSHNGFPTGQKYKSSIPLEVKNTIGRHFHDQSSDADYQSRQRRDSQIITVKTTLENTMEMTTALQTSGKSVIQHASEP